MIKLLQAVVNRLDELFPETNIYIKDTEQGLIGISAFLCRL